MAIEEATRCLNCKNKPCVSGCPVGVQIPEFIALVAEGKFLEAAAKIKETSALPAVCGRVCPQESVSASASAPLRARQSASAVWSALLLTTQWHTTPLRS